MYRIVHREVFSDTTFLWEVLAPDVARSARPGHFVMLRLHEGSERIPLTVADYNRERGTITLVIQALGKTTLEMRDRYRRGDTFETSWGRSACRSTSTRSATSCWWAAGSASRRLPAAP